jgi:citronellol/citronellal dehydrogenase
MAAISRSPEIMADAAYAILNRSSRQCTGRFFIDELVLREVGVTDFSKYAVPGAETLAADFFVPDAVFEKTDTKVMRAGLARAGG